MRYFLVKQSGNWADEFDTEGFHLFTETEWEHYKAKVKKIRFSGREFYFGTNEFMEWDSADDYLNELDVKEISELEYHTVLKLFGDDYGMFFDVVEYSHDAGDEEE